MVLAWLIGATSISINPNDVDANNVDAQHITMEHSQWSKQNIGDVMNWILNNSNGAYSIYGDCSSIKDYEFHNMPAIMELKSKYKSSLDEILICNRTKWEIPYNFTSYEDLIQITTDPKIVKSLKLKVEKQKTPRRIEDQLELLNTKYILSYKDNISLVTQLFKLSIYTSKNKTELVLKTLEQIHNIIFKLNIRIDWDSLNLSLINQLDTLTNELWLDLSEIKTSDINKHLKKSMDLIISNTKLNDLQWKNKEKVKDFQDRLTYMLLDIEKNISNNVSKNIIESKLQIFKDYHAWKKTYITPYMNDFLSKKSAELILKLEKK